MISAQKIRQIFMFGCVGGAASLTHYGVAVLAVERLGVSIYAANLVAYLSAVSISFIGHSLFTFRAPMNMANLMRFVAMSVMVFACSQALLWAIARWLPGSYSHRIEFAVLVALMPIVTYTISNVWVYKNAAAVKQSL